MHKIKVRRATYSDLCLLTETLLFVFKVVRLPSHSRCKDSSHNYIPAETDLRVFVLFFKAYHFKALTFTNVILQLFKNEVIYHKGILEKIK